MNVRKPVDYGTMYRELTAILAQNLPQMDEIYAIGKVISQRPEKGAAVAAAEFMQANFPDHAGFSPRNVRRMRDFYLTYENDQTRLRLAMKIGWTLNVVIMEAKLTRTQQISCLQRAASEKLSKKELLEMILSGAFVEESIDVPDEICYNITNPGGIKNKVAQVKTMQTFKIFYSWQSDLPGNKTRNFIRECIDEAIDLAQESEAIEAERDEATLRVTGSPDIVATLFSKIDNCDLFIADLSPCFTENQKHVKKSPNPNVLVELGYAVKTLGWERIICLCNTDFGNEYPFDIAHNRITDFSLDGKNKNEVKNSIAKIIFINIRDLRKGRPRAKDGMTVHIVGGYSFADRAVIDRLIPIEMGKQESYILHNEELLSESKSLFIRIQELETKMRLEQKQELEEKMRLEQGQELECQEVSVKSFLPAKTQSELQEAVLAMSKSFKGTETPVVWKNAENDKARIKRWLGEEVEDDFFNVGKLKRCALTLPFNKSEYNGTDDEEEKYSKLRRLSYNLLQLEARTNYLKTFDGMRFIPLAIQNISAVQDTNIRVVVQVETGDIVEPNENLIWDEYAGIQHIFCRDDDDEDVGIICELFAPTEDGTIHVENIPFEPSSYIPTLPGPFGQLSQPQKTEEDYKEELEEFIASSSGCGYYEFNIANLRPGECRWFSHGMLIKPVNGIIKVHYQIHSARSMGDLEGTLEMNTD